MRARARTRFVLAVLALTAVTLVTLDFQSGGSPLGPLRGAVSGVVGPLERAAAAVVRPVRGLVDDVSTLGSAQSRIHRLEQQNADLRQQVHLDDLAEARAAQATRLYRLQQAGHYTLLPARVVALGSSAQFERTATIDVGSSSGVHADSTVVNGDGLVGRVKSVGRDTSTVVLATDPVSTVFARLEDSLELGTVTGRGGGTLLFQLLDANERVRVGQRLVTFGSRAGQPYVAEVPIGTVTRVLDTPGALTRSAEVTPFVDFSALDTVAVVVAAPPIPRNSVLPPPPAPSPSPAAPTPSPRPAATPSPGGSPSPARRSRPTPTPTP